MRKLNDTHMTHASESWCTAVNFEIEVATSSDLDHISVVHTSIHVNICVQNARHLRVEPSIHFSHIQVLAWLGASTSSIHDGRTVANHD